MKGSRLLQGWKELASKIHPQLPLDPKESQRLLTALTSSFRQHLDEVHPHAAKEDSKPVAGVATGRARPHTFHGSSAVDTDRHLASVLTSPLLLRGETVALNASSAKTELLAQPALDPLALFERYQRRGAATLDVAIVCAVEVKRRLNKLSRAEQLDMLDNSKPGRRLLDWLVQTDVIRSAELMNNPQFLQTVVSFLMREGSEAQLWEVLRLDIGDSSPQTAGGFSKSLQQISGHKKWKAAVSQSIMKHILSAEPFGPVNANAAIAVYLLVHELEKQAWKSGKKFTCGQTAALQVLYSHIRRWPQLYAGADFGFYDKFLTAMLTNLHGTAENSIKRFRHDMMLLYHPDPARATALPSVEMLQKLFNLSSEDQKSAYWRPLVQQVFHPTTSNISKTMFESMCEVMARLQLDRQHDQAGWLQGRISDQYPQYKVLLEQRVQKAQHAQPATFSDHVDSVDSVTFTPALG